MDGRLLVVLSVLAGWIPIPPSALAEAPGSTGLQDCGARRRLAIAEGWESLPMSAPADFGKIMLVATSPGVEVRRAKRLWRMLRRDYRGSCSLGWTFLSA